jgi:hypothetical protein
MAHGIKRTKRKLKDGKVTVPKIEFIFTEDKVNENDAGSQVDENSD